MNKVALYARVSTDQQSTGLESQVRILNDYCEKNDIKNYEIFMDEGISGTKSSRPALDRMMAAVNGGEVASVVVYSFSRFARSTTHLLNALQVFKAKNVSFVSITEKIDTSTPVGLAVFSILAAISQLERDLICERVKAGLANAKAKGRQIGRKKQRDSDLIRKLLKAGMTFRQIAVIARCSHGSVWAERVAMKKDEELKRQKDLEEQNLKDDMEKSILVFPEIVKPEPIQAA